MKTAIVVLVMSVALFAQEPKPTQVPEVTKLKVLGAFKSAFIIQQSLGSMKEDLCNNNPQCAKLRVEFQKAMADYQAELTAANAALPKGETLQLTTNPDTGQPVDVVAIKQPAAPKEEKKNEKKPETK
jgi:hypothetical protein